MVKWLAQGHNCHDWASNPHFAAFNTGGWVVSELDHWATTVTIFLVSGFYCFTCVCKANCNVLQKTVGVPYKKNTISITDLFSFWSSLVLCLSKRNLNKIEDSKHWCSSYLPSVHQMYSWRQSQQPWGQVHLGKIETLIPEAVIN